MDIEPDVVPSFIWNHVCRERCWNIWYRLRQISLSLFAQWSIKDVRQFLLSGSWQMSLRVIKKYSNLYSVCIRMTLKQNYTLFFSLKVPIFSLPYSFCLLLNDKKKINGVDVIFNSGLKWVSGERCTGKEWRKRTTGEKMVWIIMIKRAVKQRSFLSSFSHFGACSSPNFFSFVLSLHIKV